MNRHVAFLKLQPGGSQKQTCVPYAQGDSGSRNGDGAPSIDAQPCEPTAADPEVPIPLSNGMRTPKRVIASCSGIL